MKFLCGSCRTKYQISDDKVRGKILTIRCKKCGAKILVRESLMKDAVGGAALAPVAEGEEALAGAVGARTGGSASLAAAYESGMDRPPSGEPDDMPTSIAPVPADVGLAGFEWYVAIDGQQHGPFAFAELVGKVQRGEIVGRHYVWHDGMADWTRVRDLPDLASYLTGSTLPNASVPPPAPAALEGGDILNLPSDRTGARSAQTEGRGALDVGRHADTEIQPVAAALTDLGHRPEASLADDLGDDLREPDGSAGNNGSAASGYPRENRGGHHPGVGESARSTAGAGEASFAGLRGPAGTPEGREASGLGSTGGLSLGGSAASPGLSAGGSGGHGLGSAASRPGEGVSRKDAAERSGGTSSSSTAPASGIRSSVPELSSLDLNDEDIFANVPRASEQELVQREPTRFFVAAAGVKNAAKKNRLGVLVGVAVVALLAGFMGLWMTGVLKISLPGIGNPFATTPERQVEDEALATDDPESFEILIGEAKTQPVDRARRAVRRPRRRGSDGNGENAQESGNPLDGLGQGGYIEEEGPEVFAGARETRGEAATPKVSIDKLGSKIQIEREPVSNVMPSSPDYVPPPDVDSLDAATIAKVVSTKKASIRLCYERSMKAKESLQGKLYVLLVVEPNGRVSKAWIDSRSFKGTVVGECIVSAVKNWRFPQFAGEAQEIELPFVLQRGV